MPTQYSIVCRNNSTSSGSFCLYQQQSAIASVPAWSLAWMVQPSTPGTESAFQWTIDYSFVWSETNTLIPGVTFDASGMLGADLTTANQVTLARSPEELSLSSRISGPARLPEAST